ncbi:protein ANTI-SILENCING 1-like [Telopea speciosissima]|uniref:protein ANTI-SILENCING 1-like n=1 Tax=Telopea speciosissima TaxID=54955 RepID=UPI001CC33C68|nr:protein ANTI-SILENCING 1-like [Telopea speciosissima]
MEATSHSKRADRVHNCEFKWGESRGDGGTDNEVQFYKSFTYDGVEYSLYDCVYMHVHGLNEPQEPYIGKLVKIWKLRDHRKYIRVVWFFRPNEILNWLGDDDASLKNEIFLACGKGEGLYNDNPLEVLVGKCNVVCTSKDSRNPQPSDMEMRRADYVFYRTFDVGKRKISNRYEDIIAGIEVRHFFNATSHRNDNWKTDSSSKLDLPKAVATLAKDGKPGVQTNPSMKGAESKRSIASGSDQGRISDEWVWPRVTTFDKSTIKTGNIPSIQVVDEGNLKSVQDSLHLEASDGRPFKRRRLLLGTSVKPSEKLESNVSPALAREESNTNILKKLTVDPKESAAKPPGFF